MPGAAQQLKPALGPGPDQRMMQGQALGGQNDMVPVAVRRQERRRASRHLRQQAQFPGPAASVGDVRDPQQPGREGERQQAGLHLGA